MGNFLSEKRLLWILWKSPLNERRRRLMSYENKRRLKKDEQNSGFDMRLVAVIHFWLQNVGIYEKLF
jgi:hypothetical protein